MNYTDAIDIAALNALYENLTTVNKPKEWASGRAQRSALRFAATFKSVAGKADEEMRGADRELLAKARTLAPEAYAAARGFDTSIADLGIPPPVPRSTQSSDAGGVEQVRRPARGTNSEALACEECRALFQAGELPSQSCRGSACPMCGDPLTEPQSPESEDDRRWWTRENPKWQFAYVRGTDDLTEHLGMVIFVETGGLVIEPDPIRPLNPEAVEAIRRSLTIGPLLAPIGITVGRRVKFGRHRVHSHMPERRWVKAHVMDDNPVTAYLALAENSDREDLSLLQRAHSTREMKRYYQEIHPETRQGLAGGLSGARHREGQQVRGPALAVPFSAVEAKRRDVSARVIHEEVQIGGIDARAIEVLLRTAAKDNKGRLLQVARAKTPDEQLAKAEQIAADEAGPVSPPPRIPRVQSVDIKLTAQGDERVGETVQAGRRFRVRVGSESVTIEIVRGAPARETNESPPV